MVRRISHASEISHTQSVPETPLAIVEVTLVASPVPHNAISEDGVRADAVMYVQGRNCECNGHDGEIMSAADRTQPGSG